MSDFSLSSLGISKDEILEEMKTARNDDLEDRVYRMQLTFDENIDIMDIKYFAGSNKICTFSPGKYEITDNFIHVKVFVVKVFLPQWVESSFYFWRYQTKIKLNL